MSQLELQVFSREEKEEAMRLVRKTVDRVNYQQGIFFTDGSFNPKNQRAAYAYICHQALGKPMSQVYPLKAEDNYFIHDIAGAEMKAVLAALKAAQKYGFKEVTLFFDALAVTHALKAFLHYEEHSDLSNSLTREFSEDVEQLVESFDRVDFVQIPSHVGIDYHDQVDQLIKQYASKLKTAIEVREIEVARVQGKEGLYDELSDHIFLLDSRQESPMGIYLNKVKKEVRILDFAGFCVNGLPLGRLQQYLLLNLKKLHKDYAFKELSIVYNRPELKSQVGADSFFDFSLQEACQGDLALNWHFLDQALGNLFNQFLVATYHLVADDFFPVEKRQEVLIQQAQDQEEEKEASLVYSTQTVEKGAFIPGQLEVKDYFGCQPEDLEDLCRNYLEEEECFALASMRTFISRQGSNLDYQWIDSKDKKRLGQIQHLETKKGKREANTEAIHHILLEMEKKGLDKLMLFLSDQIFFKILDSHSYYVGSDFSQLDAFARARGIELTLVGSQLTPDFLAIETILNQSDQEDQPQEDFYPEGL